MKQQYVAPNFDLHRGNQVYTTDQAKASNSENLPADMSHFRREREADDSLTVSPPLTCIELKRALASIKKVRVSTGLDIVFY